MINTLSKIGWEGGGSTSISIMSLNILCDFLTLPLTIFLPGGFEKMNSLIMANNRREQAENPKTMNKSNTSDIFIFIPVV